MTWGDLRALFLYLFPMVFLCVLPLQMKNTLDENICLGQGLVSSKTPVMYYCHKYSLQVSSTISPAPG